MREDASVSSALHLFEGKIIPIRAKAVLLATGGYGRIYLRSTNAVINTGSGCCLAYQAGVPLEDMEFVQFHPTSLYGTNILITEAARGEGGYLLNAKGERFMERYAPKLLELGPRDIVARGIQTEIDQGHGFEGEYVHLDLRHLGKEKIMDRLPGIRQIAIDFAGVDPILEPIPVQPAQHYSMGGIATDRRWRNLSPMAFMPQGSVPASVFMAPIGWVETLSWKPLSLVLGLGGRPSKRLRRRKEALIKQSFKNRLKDFQSDLQEIFERKGEEPCFPLEG